MVPLLACNIAASSHLHETLRLNKKVISPAYKQGLTMVLYLLKFLLQPIDLAQINYSGFGFVVTVALFPCKGADMSERHLTDDQSSTIDPYLITSGFARLWQNKAQHYKTCLNNWIPGSTSVSLI